MSNPNSMRNYRPQSGYVAYNRAFINTSHQMRPKHQRVSSFIENKYDTQGSKMNYDSFVNNNQNINSDLVSLHNQNEFQLREEDLDFKDQLIDQSDMNRFSRQPSNLLHKISHADTKALLDYNESSSQYEQGKRQLNLVKKQVMNEIIANKMHHKVVSWQHNKLEFNPKEEAPADA